MKRTLFVSIVVIVSLILSIQTVDAQKVAYVDSDIILGQLPAMKQASATLEDFQKQLQRNGKKEAAKLREDIVTFQKKVERGQISPLEQQKANEEFEKRQSKLVGLEKEMIDKIAEKRDKLLRPIYDAFNKAVKEVANERGLSMILDAERVLFAQDDADVGAYVKAKLGI